MSRQTDFPEDQDFYQNEPIKKDDLVEGLILAISEVMKDMRERDEDMYWLGQIKAGLDLHNINIYELVENKELKEFDRGDK